MKRSIFCDITSCSPFKISRHFGRTLRLGPQGLRISQARHQHEAVNPSFNLRVHFQQTTRR
jgi:hypothetical protein